MTLLAVSVRRLWVPFWVPLLGSIFWDLVWKFWRPASRGPFNRAAFIGAHFFGTQKRTLFEAERAPIQDPKNGPILEPKTDRNEHFFWIRSQKKLTGHCMILVPRLSGIMCLPVRCCAALQCRHPCSVETVTSY